MDGARSMVERGDWLVPYFRGEPFFDKPALTYWLVAASFRAFGFSAEAARLVPAAATLAVLAATVWLGTMLFDRRAGLLGGVVLATTVAFVSFGRVAMSDTLLTLWSTLAVGLWVRAYRPSPPRWVVPALGAVLGLGFQTKGPVALLLPGVGMLLLSWRRRRDGLPVTRRGLLLAALLFAVLGLGWFVLVYLRLGGEPLRWFFLRENLERFSGNTYDSGRAPWFYLGAYLAQGFPWSAFLPLAALQALGRKDAAEDAAGSRWLLGWVGLALIPLTLSRGKIDYYLLPLYPPISLVLGRYFTSAWARRDRIGARAVLLLLALLSALAAAIPFRLPPGWLPGSAAHLAFAAILLAGAALAVRAARGPEPGRVARAVAALTAATFLGASTLLLPPFLRAQPNAAIVADVGRERDARPTAEVALCEDPTRVQRELLFELRIVAVEDCALWARVASRRPSLVLVSGQEARSLEEAPRVRRVASYRYLPSTALSAAGLLRPPGEDTLALLANYPPRGAAARERWKEDRYRKERTLRRKAKRMRIEARRQGREEAP